MMKMLFRLERSGIRWGKMGDDDQFRWTIQWIIRYKSFKKRYSQIILHSSFEFNLWTKREIHSNSSNNEHSHSTILPSTCSIWKWMQTNSSIYLHTEQWYIDDSSTKIFFEKNVKKRNLVIDSWSSRYSLSNWYTLVANNTYDDKSSKWSFSFLSSLSIMDSKSSRKNSSWFNLFTHNR